MVAAAAQRAAARTTSVRDRRARWQLLYQPRAARTRDTQLPPLSDRAHACLDKVVPCPASSCHSSSCYPCSYASPLSNPWTDTLARSARGTLVNIERHQPLAKLQMPAT